MDLQTKISLKPELNRIDYGSKVLLMGSCFVENMGEKLHYYKFQTLVNPFGITFYPGAIEKLVLKAINGDLFTEEDVFYLNERWHCFDVHSDLSNPSKEALLSTLNEQLRVLDEQLRTVTHFVITLGTAWAYRLIETDERVANCHKVPQKKFLRELLSVQEITESLQAIIALLKSVNPGVQIIFTVSPVRHLRDGFTENQRSKAHLITALHEVVEPRKQLFYFPSYEIMMDELRDYRFYAEDMVHPSKLAVDYIWEKFHSVWIAEAAGPVMKVVDSVQKGLAHRPFDPTSEAYSDFMQSLQKKIEELQMKHPHMIF